MIAFSDQYSNTFFLHSSATSNFENAPSSLLASGAYQPEEGYDSLDLSMPSYNVEKDSLAATDIMPPSSPEKEASLKAKANLVAQKKAEKRAEREAIQKIAAERQAARAAERAEKAQAKALAEQE